MLCSLGFDPDRNAYHIIAGYFKQFETIDVLPLQLKLWCACPDSKESLWLLFYKKKQIFKSLASLLTKTKTQLKNIESLEAQQHESQSSNDPELIDET